MSFTDPFKGLVHNPTTPGWYLQNRATPLWWNGEEWLGANPDVYWPSEQTSHGSLRKLSTPMVVAGMLFFVMGFAIVDAIPFFGGIAFLISFGFFAGGGYLALNTWQGNKSSPNWGMVWKRSHKADVDKLALHRFEQMRKMGVPGDIKPLNAGSPPHVVTAFVTAPANMRKTLTNYNHTIPVVLGCSSIRFVSNKYPHQMGVYVNLEPYSVAGFAVHYSATDRANPSTGNPRWIGYVHLQGRYALPATTFTPQNFVTKTSEMVTDAERTSESWQANETVASDFAQHQTPILTPRVLELVTEAVGYGWGVYFEGDVIVVRAMEKDTDVVRLFELTLELYEALPQYLYV